jgi:hypothetical protein
MKRLRRNLMAVLVPLAQNMGRKIVTQVLFCPVGGGDVKF